MREVYREFQLSDDIVGWSGAKGCLDHRFCAPPAGLHCPIAYSASTQSQQPVNRMWLIKSSRFQGLAETLRQHLNEILPSKY